MIKSDIQKAVNDQIQEEFQSAYIYLAMSAWFEEENLDGFAHWMFVQWEEEIEHAMKFYRHILRRGGKVELQTLEAPEVEIKNAADAFKIALKHEQHITSRIHSLYELAQEHNDYPLQTLLHWFIDEQVEEEENTSNVLEELQRIGDDGSGLVMLDREMGQRQPEEDEGEAEA